MDVEAPDVPDWNVAGVRMHEDSAFAELNVVGGDPTFVLDVDEESLLDERLPDGGIAAIDTLGANPELGPGEADSNLSVRAAAFDLAGNFSGWGPTEDVLLSDGCGCSARLPGGGPRSLLLAVVLLSCRRRGRRRQPCR
jgi:hypothetical protein